MNVPHPLARDGADWEALSRLHGACFEKAWSAESLATLLATPGTFSYAVVSERTPLGFIVVRCAADEAEILTLAVRPEDRRRGIGQALVRAAAEASATQGAKTLFLEVARENGPACALYRALAFEVLGKRPGYYETAAGPAKDALVLGAQLPLPVSEHPPTR